MSVEIEPLDTRRFQDIVDEAKRKITKYSPQWTNHNISDPGVALIELFAWMTEMTLFQLNEVPDREMKVLLDAVGFELFPAQAASVDLTFALAAGTTAEIRVDAGTQVAAPLDGQQVFETRENLQIVQPQFTRCRAEQRDGRLTPSPEPTPRAGGGIEIRFEDPDLVCFDGLEAARPRWMSALAQVEASRRETWRPDRFVGDVVYFGFESSLAHAVVRADFEVSTVAGLGIDPTRPPLIWESSTATGWNRCERLARDLSGGFNLSGSVDIQIPADHESMMLQNGSSELFWLRVRVDLESRDIKHVYMTSPRLRSVAFTTVGGTTLAVNTSRSKKRSTLGVSDGASGQRFRLDRPVVGGSHAISVWVSEMPWTEVKDFADADEGARVFVVDEAAGEISFGPLVHQAVGPPKQYGAIPFEGAEVTASFDVGGGEAGNVGPNRITSMHQAIKGVASVSNRRAAKGGVEPETLEEALQRAPMSVRSGDRAVTAADFERIVRDAARDVHSVRCSEPDTPGGPVRVLVVPKLTSSAADRSIDDYALSEAMRDRIEEHLRPRRLVGTRVMITTPHYLGISVVVRVRPASDSASTHWLRDKILRTLYEFINPVGGGDDGAGLGFGEMIDEERIRELARHISGVGAVLDVALFEVDLRRDLRSRQRSRQIVLPDDTLFVSYRHSVMFESEARR